jgi:putative hemolysin
VTVFWYVLAIVLGIGTLTLAGQSVRAVSRFWLRAWVEKRLRGAALAESYLDEPHRLLQAAGAGTATLAALGGVGVVALRRDEPVALAIWLVTLALLALVLGQALPRAAGTHWATRLAPVLLPLLQVVELIMLLLLVPARAIARALAPREAGTPQEQEREALEEILREGEREGVSEPGEREIITGLVAFGDKTLADVLTPRAQVFAIDAALAPSQAARAIAHAGYTRVPVMRGSLEQVIGMVHVRDVLATEGDAPLPLRPVTVAAPTQRCSDQLFLMLRQRTHLALVRDGDGPVLGLVTLEDLLEEVVGDIDDEHDETTPDA